MTLKNKKDWQIAIDCILEAAEAGATIKQIKKALDLSYGYVQLNRIQQVLIESGFTRVRWGRWSKKDGTNS